MNIIETTDLFLRHKSSNAHIFLQIDLAQSFDSAFLPGASSDMAAPAPPDKKILTRTEVIDQRSVEDNANNMEYEEPGPSTSAGK